MPNNFLRSDTVFTTGDEELQKKWPDFKTPIGTIEDKKQSKREVRYNHLEHGKYKLNFDGAAKGNPGQAGTGCIIRDHNGDCVWAISRKIGSDTNNEVEMEAITMGLQLCRAKGIGNIDIEGDSQLCIQAAIKKEIHNWNLKGWLQKIGELLNELKEYSLSHVYREANIFADRLANHVVYQE
ncbi:uncharacterized protein LOC131029183 [Cryptomeria japonica]|uniref:uncharacterized protein LOC131029183 n=1 Tax=Cryptomeria japonica TaxID=3369 RepID=UPI0027DA7139|nr:uncharacterized protein LOC131029183 [Cryptomeria japonica]